MTILLHPQHTPDDADERMNGAVRANLVMAPPPELATRLLALAQPATQSRVDLAVRSALVIEPPAALQARLQALVPQPEYVVVPVTTTRPLAKVMYALTALALGVLLVVGLTLYSQALTQLGSSTLWAELSAIPGMWLGRLYAVLPSAHLIVDTYKSLQRPLEWLLVALVLWAALDMRTPQRTRQIA
ncbi:MAG: hypothetical protein H0X37_05005 [Herpetosiphonaceae bacterium]|nr:hypothetical protein [Herpetosiphonaceae bacterium]